MRKPGELITRAEQKEHGLTRSEAREIERRERLCGEILLGVDSPQSEKMGRKEAKKAEKAARMEALGRQKRAWWAGGGYENAAQAWGRRKFDDAFGIETPEGRDLEAVLPDHERQQILVEEIRKFTSTLGSPWSVQAQGPTWAQLVDPAGDPIGTGGTVMAVATLGLSLAATPARRGRNNDKHLYIDVEPNGTVNRSGSLLYGGTDYSNVPMLDD